MRERKAGAQVMQEGLASLEREESGAQVVQEGLASLEREEI
ncbi:hypothetical protein [Evansella clarkii]|nr:hypothetical protein [Evansella clarkii]